MSFDFVIPLSKDGLLRRSGLNHYVVDELLPARLFSAKLQEYRATLRSQGPLCMLQCFDGLFSVLMNAAHIDVDIKEDAWNFVVKVVSSTESSLPSVVDGEVDADLRHSHLNALKMSVYLLCQFMETFEAEAGKPLAVATAGKGRRKKKSQSVAGWDWDGEKERGLLTLSQLFQLPVHRLWDPPVVEEEFVNLVTCCCYKMLENTNIALQIGKTTREAIFQLLGIMIKRYNHALGASLKVIQLLQHFEHLTIPLVQAVELFSVEFGVKTIVSEIMREIGRMDAKDLARDNSGTRAYAGFLVELSDRIPSLMLPSISVLISHLDEESYTMRNGVLGVMGEILVKCLSDENLDANMKTTRDQFLDKLEDHIHDVNAFVRSRSLSIWLNIINEKAIPLARQQNVVELVIGRLKDKSCQVRKHAVQVIIALLRNNPYAAKLSVEDLKESYEKEKEKLKTMIPKVDTESARLTVLKEKEEEWQRISESVQKAVAALILTDEEQAVSADEASLKQDDDMESVIEKFSNMMIEEKYTNAYRLLLAARDTWPDQQQFMVNIRCDINEVTSEDKPGNAEEEEEKQEGDVQKDSVVDQEMQCLKKLYLDACINPAAVLASEDFLETETTEQSPEVNELAKQKVLVQYLKNTMTFGSQLQAAVPVICQMLTSKSTTDVMEAINFFVTGFEFGISNAMVGVRKMLILIWSREQTVKEAVVAAYKRLYLSTPEGSNRANALNIVNNLIALCSGATLGDMTSLEELISEFVRTKEIGSDVIQLLWEKFTQKLPDSTVDESHTALQLLAMAASADVDIVRSNINVLIQEGLGAKAEEDYLLARDACLALIKLAPSGKPKTTGNENPFRFPEDHELFAQLSQLVLSGVDRLEQANWIPMAEQAVNVIYRLSENPDRICANLIKKMAASIVNCSKTDSTQIISSEDMENSPPDSQNPETSLPSEILTRLLSLAGNVALRQLVHLDVHVLSELKRRNNLQEEKNKNPQSNKADKTKDTTQGESIEEELGLAGAAADDAEMEYVKRLTDQELVTGTNLLAMLRPLLVAVCSNPTRFPDKNLRASASLALAKYMLVSGEFCEAHLQLLFTILEKSPYPVIRANTIIALGDLTFRFPNLIEPWTPHLYARLRDSSTQVRKNTLMVLTHLILNDMIKVKGQISELAMCVVDDDERISDLARLFFQELAKKGNAVYNIMPDIISRLSDPDVGTEEQHFRTIMKFLFSFIQKDRQCESLVEKLCHRFRATRVDRQWRDLSFCMSLLSYSEKSVRKLQENFACFGDKLADDEVYSCFMSIISGAKKFAKPESKVLVDELEQRVEHCHQKGLDDDDVAQKASKASATARASKGKTPAKTPGRKRATRAKKNMEPWEEDSEGSEEDFHPARRGALPRTQKNNKPKLSFSSDEESDVELFDVKGKKGEEADVLSDAENADPNTTSPFAKPPVKSRTKSRSKTAQTTPRSSRRTRVK